MRKKKLWEFILKIELILVICIFQSQMSYVCLDSQLKETIRSFTCPALNHHVLINPATGMHVADSTVLAENLERKNIKQKTHRNALSHSSLYVLL